MQGWDCKQSTPGQYALQHSMTEFSNAETEEVRTMVIAKLVSFIMKQNGH
jgi:hypothetical protein